MRIARAAKVIASPEDGPQRKEHDMAEQHTPNDRPMPNRPRVRRRTWRQAAFGAGALVTVAVTLGLSSPAFAAEAAPADTTSQVVETPVAQGQGTAAQPTEAPAVNRASADSATASVVGLGLLNEQQRDELVTAYVVDDAASAPSETTALAYNSTFSDDLIEVLSA